MGHGLDLGYNNVGWVPGVNTKQTCSVNTRYQQYLVDYKYWETLRTNSVQQFWTFSLKKSIIRNVSIL